MKPTCVAEPRSFRSEMEGTTREVPPQVVDSDGAEGAAEAPLGSSATLEDPPTTHVPREEEAAVSGALKFGEDALAKSSDGRCTPIHLKVQVHNEIFEC